MSALAVDCVEASSSSEWDTLVRIWEETVVPEGCKVEIMKGIVTVAPPPSSARNDIADCVQRRLYQVIPKDWGIYQTLGAATPTKDGPYIPDIAVVPRRALRSGSGEYVSVAEAELLVEITSKSNASSDRITKAAAYAAAGVPLYLLVDAWAPGGPTITLYGEPKGELYRVLSAGKFGDPIRIPGPFGLDLDTSEFPDGG